MSVVTADSALSGIPDGLRKPLLSEYSQIINNFMEHRWTAAELSGGRFCEIVYTILDGHARGSYPAFPTKPERLVDACRRLENNSSVPRSFQILIPRLLPALYEIRNNRNVGHVGGDVEPDPMDSSAVVSISSWILAELIRVFHGVGTEAAQKIVDELSERRLPLVWKSGDVRRVLKPTLQLPAQILLLLASSSSRVHFNELLSWTEHKNKSHFTKSLRGLHKARMLEFNETSQEIELLPPGVERAAELVRKMGTTPRFS